jgi:hypothetical protein
MAKKIIVYFISFLLILCIGGFINKNYILYYYYMRELRNTTKGAYIILLNSNIQKLGPSVKHLLVKTFEDKGANEKNINAATLTLVRIDKEAAEQLFLKYLSVGNTQQISQAIFGLTELGIAKYNKEIIPYAESTNEGIRASVASYLGLIYSEESKVILSNLVKDNNPHVSYNATISLGD